MSIWADIAGNIKNRMSILYLKLPIMQNLHKKMIIPLAAVIVMLTYLSCQKGLIGDVTTITTPVDDITQVNASIEGYVTNENGLPVNGAVVISGVAGTSTDNKGYFRFNNISLSKNNGFVKVMVPGYFTGSRSFVTNAGRVNYVRIQLIPKTNIGNIDAVTGGTVTLPSGVSVSLPAGSVVNATSGASYTGTVKVAAAWINPVSVALSEQMPGDLRGINSSGGEDGLQTFGMVAVELTGSGGELLQIAMGKKAIVNFPIPASIASYAPSSIALWYFDENAGRWKEDGAATKTGNSYVADVSHFSFWNCDAQFPLITFSATVLSTAGKPLVNAQVRIRRTSNNGAGYGMTDSAGYVSGKIPSNETLVLEVLDQCGAIIYTQNMGPYTSNVSLGTITASNPTTTLLTISGSITDCSNQPVTNGYVQVYINGRYYRTNVNNGNYSITITNCSTVLSFTVLGVNNSTNEVSSPQTVSIGSQNVVVPVFQACGTSILQTIDYTVDGTNYIITSPPDSVFCSITGSGTNNFNYVGGYNTGSTRRITFSFTGAVTGTGNYPINYMTVSQVDSASIITTSPVVTITQYGTTGQFIVGNLSVQLKKLSDNSIHPVSCTFRMRRN